MTGALAAKKKIAGVEMPVAARLELPLEAVLSESVQVGVLNNGGLNNGGLNNAILKEVFDNGVLLSTRQPCEPSRELAVNVLPPTVLQSANSIPPPRIYTYRLK